jgi:lysophospholipase L1-like esterase
MKHNRFEQQIRIFERNQQKNSLNKGAIVFVGSSSIRGWRTLKKDMAPLTVINRGFGGSQAADALYYVDRIVTPYQPKKIVYYEGDNDIAQGKSPEQFLRDCQDFVKKVHSTLPKTIIYFLSIKPSLTRSHLQNTMQEANKLLQAYTKTHHELEYIDISTAMYDEMGKIRQDIFQADGLHLNAKGYEIWTQIIKQRIQ